MAATTKLRPPRKKLSAALALLRAVRALQDGRGQYNFNALPTRPVDILEKRRLASRQLTLDIDEFITHCAEDL